MKRLTITSALHMIRKDSGAVNRTKYLVAGAILLSLFALSWPFVSANSQDGGLTVEDNTDRPGADYKDFDLSQPNWALCRDACANDGNCQAYSYVRPGVQGPNARCWLKSSAPGGVGNNCCISGAKSSGLSALDNVDLPGADYKDFDLPQANYELCRNACANDSNCRAYSFVRPGVQGPSARCWLKSSVPAAVSSNCCISGARSGGGGTVSGGKGFAGTWNAYSWGTVTIEQNGNQVTGRYTEPAGRLQGVIRGDKLYFSYRHDSGGEGEAVWYPVDPNPNRLGGKRCAGRGCNPDGYYDVQRQ